MVEKDKGSEMTSAKMGFGVQKKAFINMPGEIERWEKLGLLIREDGYEIDDDSKMAERANSFFESSFNRKNEANKFGLLGYNENPAK